MANITHTQRATLPPYLPHPHQVRQQHQVQRLKGLGIRHKRAPGGKTAQGLCRADGAHACAESLRTDQRATVNSGQRWLSPATHLETQSFCTISVLPHKLVCGYHVDGAP